MNDLYPGSDIGPATATSTDALGASDDPRVASVLAAYLAELEAGRQPSREELLENHPEIALTLADWFDVVEFVHLAAESVSSSRPRQPAEDALPADTTLGEYRLVREIGRGGMGIVYEAEQVSLGRRVALKVLSGTAALDPLKLQRFRVETQAVAQLNHPHIVPIFAVGSERGTHYYAMQYIEGTTLAEVIHQQRRFGRAPAGEAESRPGSSGAGAMATGPRPAIDGHPDNGANSGAFELSPSGLGDSGGTSSFRRRGAFRALANLAIQAADALAHAHAMGILHRDIKPSNLLVDAKGYLWVTDFGLARFQDEPGLTRTGDLLGTLRYMAPELVTGNRLVHDPRSDSYSLGATLYELLTLKPVFEGRDRQAMLRQIAQEEPVPPRKHDPTIPRNLETIVLKAMDKEPGRRYATTQELAEDLRRFLEDKSIHARPPSPLELGAKWARRHHAVLRAAGAVGFVALAIAAPILWMEQQNTARVNKNLREAFGQADLGFEQMIRLSDDLTLKGMARYSEVGVSPESIEIRADFFRRAIAFYDRLAREPHIAKPMRALAFERLGFARMVGMQDPQAENDFRQSITLYHELLTASPQDPDLRCSLSDAQMNLGMHLMFSQGINAALPTFERTKSIDLGLVSEFPGEPTVLDRLTEHSIQIALWKVSAAMRTQAEQDLRQLIATYENVSSGEVGSSGPAPSRAALYDRLGRALEAAGRFREAREAFRRGLKLAGDDPSLLNNLAWSLALQPDAPPRESAEAIELAKHALKVNPKEGAFWNTLGLAYLRAGQWPLATDAVNKSITMRPHGGDAADRFMLAMICWRRGNKEAALDWYVQALDRLASDRQPDGALLALRAEAQQLLGRSH
jgi:eukaryotic-like serine/threonine-protein kinase